MSNQIQMTVLVEGVSQPYLGTSPYPSKMFDTSTILGGVAAGFLIPEVQGIGGNMWSFTSHPPAGAPALYPALQFRYATDNGNGSDTELYVVSGSLVNSGAGYNELVNAAAGTGPWVLTPIAPF